MQPTHIIPDDLWVLLGFWVFTCLIGFACGYLCGRTDGLAVGWRRWGLRK